MYSISEVKSLLEKDSIESIEMLVELLNNSANIEETFERWSEFSIDEKLKLCKVMEKVQSIPILAAKIAKAEDDLKVKASLVKILYKVGDEAVIEILAEFLKHPDRRIRANAVEALGIMNSRKIKDLLMPYLEDPDNRVRANTAVALWKFPEIREKVKQAFEEMLRNENKWMKASAFYAFGEIGIREFLEQLVNDLYNSDEDLAKNAFLALVSYSEKVEEEL